MSDRQFLWCWMLAFFPVSGVLYAVLGYFREWAMMLPILLLLEVLLDRHRARFFGI